MRVGALILAELEARGWTVQQLCEKTGIPPFAMNKILDGKNLPQGWSTKLGQAFGLSRAYFEKARVMHVESVLILTRWQKANGVDPDA